MMPGQDRRARPARMPWASARPRRRDEVRAGAARANTGSAAGVAGRTRTGLGDRSGGGTRSFGEASSETDARTRVFTERTSLAASPLHHYQLSPTIVSSSISRAMPFEMAVNQQEHSTCSGTYAAAW